ncbi:unnamed protein product, partial [Phaeothamnion confervicola]
MSDKEASEMEHQPKKRARSYPVKTRGMAGILTPKLSFPEAAAPSSSSKKRRREKETEKDKEAEKEEEKKTATKKQKNEREKKKRPPPPVSTSEKRTRERRRRKDKNAMKEVEASEERKPALDEWGMYREKFKRLLSRIGREQFMLDVYDAESRRSANKARLKPRAELEQAARRAAAAQAEARATVRAIAEAHTEGARWDHLEDDDGVDVDDVACTRCGRRDADDADDLLLCDFRSCYRAFHQRCLVPPVPPEDMPDEEDDWFCPQCECLTDCLELLEELYPGRRFESWRDVFPELETGGGTAAAGHGVGGGDTSEEDEDFTLEEDE